MVAMATTQAHSAASARVASGLQRLVANPARQHQRGESPFLALKSRLSDYDGICDCEGCHWRGAHGARGRAGASSDPAPPPWRLRKPSATGAAAASHGTRRQRGHVCFHSRIAESASTWQRKKAQARELSERGIVREMRALRLCRLCHFTDHFQHCCLLALPSHQHGPALAGLHPWLELLPSGRNTCGTLEYLEYECFELLLNQLIKAKFKAHSDSALYVQVEPN